MNKYYTHVLVGDGGRTYGGHEVYKADEVDDEMEKRNNEMPFQLQELVEVYKAAKDLYDNRLGWSDGRNPYAPKEFWARLAEALKEGE